jgi:hypothetical protein
MQREGELHTAGVVLKVGHWGEICRAKGVGPLRVRNKLGVLLLSASRPASRGRVLGREEKGREREVEDP